MQPQGNVPALTPSQELARNLNEVRPHFKAILPQHIDPDQFNRVVVTAANLTPELATADRRSLLNACSKCASDGLLPDGREAALVMFGGKVQYMPMVAGVIKRLRQSGEVSAVAARIVYDGELQAGLFRYVIEDGVEKLTHSPMLFGDRGKPALVYATARMKDGSVQNEVMTVADVEKVRKVSRSSGNGPWVQWWEEMARKTVIRRLSKYLPFSAEDRRIFHDHHEETEFEQAKALAMRSQPQSIETAALALAAPAADVGGGESADTVTGEILTPGEGRGADATTVPAIDVHTNAEGQADLKRWHADAMAAIPTLQSPAEIDAFETTYAVMIKRVGDAKRAWGTEIGDALQARGIELSK